MEIGKQYISGAPHLLPRPTYQTFASMSLFARNPRVLGTEFKKYWYRGAWVARSVEHLILAQVTISWFVSSSPASGSVLTARSLEPALDFVSPSLSLPQPTHILSLSLSKIHKH